MELLNTLISGISVGSTLCGAALFADRQRRSVSALA